MIKVRRNWVPGIRNDHTKDFYYTCRVGSNLGIHRYGEQERLRVAEYFSILSNCRLEVKKGDLYKSA